MTLADRIADSITYKDAYTKGKSNSSEGIDKSSVLLEDKISAIDTAFKANPELNKTLDTVKRK